MSSGSFTLLETDLDTDRLSGLGFLSCTEVGSRDQSAGLWSLNMSARCSVAIGFGI